MGEQLDAHGKRQPAAPPEQVRAVREALAAQAAPVTAAELARHFVRARAAKVGELLKTLVTLGQARELEGGRFAGG